MRFKPIHTSSRKFITLLLVGVTLLLSFSNLVVPVRSDTVTTPLYSELSRDGHIFKSEVNDYPPDQVTQVNTGSQYIAVGQKWVPLYNPPRVEYRKYRGYLSFDTSSIPDNALVTSLTLRLMTYSWSGSPINFEMWIVGRFIGEGPPIYDNLDVGDWDAGVMELTYWEIADYPGNEAWIDIPIPTDQIDTGGRTQFQLVTNRDLENEGPPVYDETVWFYSGDSGNEPILEVTYESDQVEFFAPAPNRFRPYWYFDIFNDQPYIGGYCTLDARPTDYRVNAKALKVTVSLAGAEEVPGSIAADNYLGAGMVATSFESDPAPPTYDYGWSFIAFLDSSGGPYFQIEFWKVDEYFGGATNPLSMVYSTSAITLYDDITLSMEWGDHGEMYFRVTTSTFDKVIARFPLWEDAMLPYFPVGLSQFGHVKYFEFVGAWSKNEHEGAWKTSLSDPCYKLLHKTYWNRTFWAYAIHGNDAYLDLEWLWGKRVYEGVWIDARSTGYNHHQPNKADFYFDSPGYTLSHTKLWDPNEFTERMDIGPTTPYKIVAGQGGIVNVTVTIENEGIYNQDYAVTLYVGDYNVEPERWIGVVGEASGEITPWEGPVDLEFVWNTTTWKKWRYGFRAVVWNKPVKTSLYTSTWILLTIPGDVDADGEVTIFDIVKIVGQYGKLPGDPDYDSACDVDSDADIDIFDMVIAATHYGQGWDPPPP